MPPPLHSLAAIAATIKRADGRVYYLAQRRRDTGEWEPPGGIVEHGEHPWDAAAREALEETGIVVRVRSLSAVFIHTLHELRPVSLIFRCSYLSGEPSPSPEAYESAWLTRQEVERRMKQPQAVRTLLATDLRKGNVPVVLHDGTKVIASL